MHHHGHSHEHASGTSHGHAHHRGASGRILLAALALTLAFAAVELLAGWHSGSLALLADAGHMVTDGAALGISAFAAWLAARPPSQRHTYGYGKAELLAALVNGLTMLAVVFGIALEAWRRLRSPGTIDGTVVSGVAFVGLCVNLLVAWMLSRGQPSLNVRAALLHVMGDLLGSVVALAAGAVIWLTGWTPIDPLLSILMGGLILASSIRLLQEALRGALDAVPGHIDLNDLGGRLAAIPGVREIHDLHIWAISAEQPALSAHVRIAELSAWPRTLAALVTEARRAGIEHVAFQPALEAEGAVQPIYFHPPRN